MLLGYQPPAGLTSIINPAPSVNRLTIPRAGFSIGSAKGPLGNRTRGGRSLVRLEPLRGAGDTGPRLTRSCCCASDRWLRLQPLGVSGPVAFSVSGHSKGLCVRLPPRSWSSITTSPSWISLNDVSFLSKHRKCRPSLCAINLAYSLPPPDHTNTGCSIARRAVTNGWFGRHGAPLRIP